VFPFPHKKWTGQEWNQLKNLTKVGLIALLRKDDRWTFVEAKGAQYVFHNPKIKRPFDYLSVHYHPKDGFRNPSLLRQLLDQWCCTVDDLRRWKVIK
jgi:hypothetical protein